MLLSKEDAQLVSRLHCALMQFVNDKLGVIGPRGVPVEYDTLRPEQRVKVVQGFLERMDLLDAFVAKNPASFSEAELEIVKSWRHRVAGRFIALRQLRKHMILLACDGSRAVYAVTGLIDPIPRVIGRSLPAMVEMVLLPFRGKIVYNGIVATISATFGTGARRGFEEQLRAAKAAKSVVTALSQEPLDVADTRPKANKSKPSRSSRGEIANPRKVLKQVIRLTDAFCQQRLNEEYLVLCRKLAETLAAERPSPLLRGQAKTWACGVVCTIGWVNLLDDPSQLPHMRWPAIDRAFGVRVNAGRDKSKAIRQLLRIRPFDFKWMLPSRWESVSSIWMLQVENGSIIDIRDQSVAMQRSALEQGLIPYVPADREVAAVHERIATSTTRRLFQFKITLRGIEPGIWRRIQVLDHTLDRLHEHLQIAMGWTNSHLHEFIIQGRRCGDPELLDDDIDPFSGLDSTTTLMSAVLPSDGSPLSFEYRYDFGDGWVHDVQFEGSPSPHPDLTYPQCLEGARACPPEDVGGVYGYADYLKAMADPSDERHQEMVNWRGQFNPELFHPRIVTHVLQEGMPDWRQKE